MTSADPRFAPASKAAGVKDSRVLEAMAAVPRERFLPGDQRDSASADRPVPLPHEQTSSQPSLIALMVEALSLTPHSRVLEVGTGHGYQTAILARLAAHVWSIERWATLAQAAEGHLHAMAITNVDVVVGDGMQGLPDQAPFDAIVVSAASRDLPLSLLDQLTVGGRLVIPLGPRHHQRCVVLQRTPEAIEQVGDLGPVRFVPLVSGVPGEMPSA